MHASEVAAAFLPAENAVSQESVEASQLSGLFVPSEADGDIEEAGVTTTVAAEALGVNKAEHEDLFFMLAMMS